MSRHVQETDLALFLSGDLNAWDWLAVRWHVGRCESCRALVQAYREDRERLKRDTGDLPAGLNWDRLAAEMTANIRVGLAAGECVAPRPRKRAAWGWRPLAIGVGATALLVGAFWLNLPAAHDTEVVTGAIEKMVHGGPVSPAAATDEHEPMVEASPSGVKWKENGTELRMLQGEARPVTVSVAPGSASARYIDPDTGQVEIQSVYVQ